jgi:hypothetical protein
LKFQQINKFSNKSQKLQFKQNNLKINNKAKKEILELHPKFLIKIKIINQRFNNSNKKVMKSHYMIIKTTNIIINKEIKEILITIKIIMTNNTQKNMMITTISKTITNMRKKVIKMKGIIDLTIMTIKINIKVKIQVNTIKELILESTKIMMINHIKKETIKVSIKLKIIINLIIKMITSTMINMDKVTIIINLDIKNNISHIKIMIIMMTTKDIQIKPEIINKILKIKINNKMMGSRKLNTNINKKKYAKKFIYLIIYN